MDSRFKIPSYLSKSISRHQLFRFPSSPLHDIYFIARAAAMPPIYRFQCTKANTAFGFDPYTYTSGRWLRDDHYERSSRYIAFDFGALCDRVLQLCPDAISIDSCKKLEGGFNRVFVFTMNNSRQLVARLPFVLAGPARLVTSSEVATIRYLQLKTKIPIPQIIDWNDDAKSPENTIGSEYIIMEHASGVQLSQVWDDMTGDQRVRCISAIFQKMKGATDLRFPSYGSIYLQDGLVHPFARQPLNEDFCIGPHCGSRYWPLKTRQRLNYGPWDNLDSFCEGLIDAGLANLSGSARDLDRKPSYYGSIDQHTAVLNSALPVLKQMSSNSCIVQSASPLLFHPDLHKRNIFVSEEDPTIITGIIDWQGASIEPAFWYSDDLPDFATPTDSDEDLYYKAYKASSQYYTPALSMPKSMDENLFRPFHYSYRTWKDGAIALHHEMVETARNWKGLNFEGQCLYSIPTSDSLLEYERAYRLFVAAQNLRYDLSNLLNSASDGWVPTENWEVTQTAHKEIFDGMLQAVLSNQNPEDDEPVQDEETLRSIWPFDLP
ncbi:hypothetical protein BO86DRAFT_390040 [Aspergillus japonicus CBS 114.51]|uniref:Altered inheritance of mitochondria protein 9, mitochondrial n=1 Tax=Aspergillus japonicus CBS 114.51 TaxID=1448312 RepID=A0A8T8WYD1_ASPJA|nr:hypothetical protein BO86DRAFT_390040 [Aspergillus japonicus CBS 114.51]RAH80876.1 hypothetical protein BO86DRAFT_390040 [Aspergillus japonicus CBS 114.51]